MSNEVLSVFLQEFLRQVLPWAAGVAAAIVIQAAARLWLAFRESRPDEAAVLERVARMAVYAAEQAKLNEAIADKKAYALDWAEGFLRNRYGLKLDLKDLSLAIEAEVGKMNVWSEAVEGPVFLGGDEG